MINGNGFRSAATADDNEKTVSCSTPPLACTSLSFITPDVHVERRDKHQVWVSLPNTEQHRNHRATGNGNESDQMVEPLCTFCRHQLCVCVCVCCPSESRQEVSQRLQIKGKHELRSPHVKLSQIDRSPCLLTAPRLLT